MLNARSHILFLIAMLSVPACPVFAQQTLEMGENYYYENEGVVYDREFTVDLKLHTNGFAAGVNIAQIKTYYLTTYLNFEFGELNSPKQYRQSFDFRASSNGKVSKSFVYGKENNFYVLRAGYGQKRYFSEKAKRKGLAIGMSYELGPSLGLLKPYYLELLYQEPGDNGLITRAEKYSDQNANVFLDITRIFGGGPWTEGIGELGIMPGGHAELALHFDWGAFDEFVKAIEVGVMCDFYFKKVPIMVESPLVDNTENVPVMLNLFLSLQLGKRW